LANEAEQAVEDPNCNDGPKVVVVVFENFGVAVMKESDLMKENGAGQTYKNSEMRVTRDNTMWRTRNIS
jgi:hypothetical protein